MTNSGILLASRDKLELEPKQRTFCDSTRVLVEAGDDGDVAGPGLGGRPRVADAPPALLLDHPAQERRSVPPPLVWLEELVRPEPVRCTHRKPSPHHTHTHKQHGRTLPKSRETLRSQIIEGE